MAILIKIILDNYCHLLYNAHNSGCNRTLPERALHRKITWICCRKAIAITDALTTLSSPEMNGRTMGKSQRDKGARFERDIVNRLRSAGIDAARVPLSGMGHEANGDEDFAGDIRFKIKKLGWLREKIEAKKSGSARGFALIYRWLGKNRALACAGDRKETLIVIRLDDFLTLLREGGFGEGSGEGS